MKEAIWSRVGPATGVLFFALIFTGFLVHGYPAVRPTDAQLAQWLAHVDLTKFRVGVYIEAVAIAFLIPFVAWLYGHLRQGVRDSSAPAVAMLVAAGSWVALTLPINESWIGLVVQAQKGLDIRVAQTVVSINQAWYDMTGIVIGLFVLAAGVAVVRRGSMSRWVGWAAVIIGVVQVASAPSGLDATPAALLAYVWILGVACYYTFRPARERERVAGTAYSATATGLPASS